MLLIINILVVLFDIYIGYAIFKEIQLEYKFSKTNLVYENEDYKTLIYMVIYFIVTLININLSVEHNLLTLVQLVTIIITAIIVYLIKSKYILHNLNSNDKESMKSPIERIPIYFITILISFLSKKIAILNTGDVLMLMLCILLISTSIYITKLSLNIINLENLKIKYKEELLCQLF